MIDIFFYNPDTGKKIAEANYLQGLHARPAIERTVDMGYQEKALKELNRKLALAGYSQKPSSFKKPTTANRSMAEVADSLDVEYIGKLKREKNYKKIIFLLKEPVALIENYGVERLEREHQKRGDLLKDLENDEICKKWEERYLKLARILGVYGHALKEMGALNSASHYLMKAIEMNHYDWEAYYDMAFIYEKKGEYAKAVNFYRAAGNLSDTGTFLSEVGSNYVREPGHKDLKKPEEKQKIPFAKTEELTEPSSHKENWRTNLKKRFVKIWESVKGIF